MIRSCSNCAGKITYNILKHKLVCNSCSSTFDVQQFNHDEVAEYESNQYVCKSCGGTIAINDSEASTFCIYCGNTNVVFDRVISEKAPTKIVPFKITKDQALDKIREAIATSKNVPKALKNLKDIQVAGVYVPFYVTDVEYDGSVVTNGLNLLNGYGKISGVLNDASSKFDDEVSSRLEPFHLDEAVDFTPDYLLGFHSNIPDVIPEVAVFKAKNKAVKEATKLYHALKDPIVLKTDYVYRRDTMEVYDDPTTVLLPVWFVTFKCNGESHTLTINGQTGKLTGVIPIDYSKLRLKRNLIAAAIALLVVGVYSLFWNSIIHEDLRGQLIVLFSCMFLIGFLTLVPVIILKSKAQELTYAEQRTRDEVLSIFAQRRQKGE